MVTKQDFGLWSPRKITGTKQTSSCTSKTTYRPARSLEEVILAWRNVHQCYLESGLVSENPHRIHLVPQAVSPATLVVMTEPPPGAFADDAEHIGIATISGYPDLGEGLPLDDVFRKEMDELRAAGRNLMEVGLLADGRTGMSRCMETKFALMRWVYFYGLYAGQTDLVLGVHPRHVAFYQRFLGCVQFAAESTCPRVNNAKVVGLRLDLLASLHAVPRPRGIATFLSEPITRDDLADRFLLRWSAIEGTVIGDYLGQLKEAPRYVNRLAQLEARPHPWNVRLSGQFTALRSS
jgi:hypothetical protein